MVRRYIQEHGHVGSEFTGGIELKTADLRDNHVCILRPDKIVGQRSSNIPPNKNFFPGGPKQFAKKCGYGTLAVSAGHGNKGRFKATGRKPEFADNRNPSFVRRIQGRDVKRHAWTHNNKIHRCKKFFRMASSLKLFHLLGEFFDYLSVDPIHGKSIGNRNPYTDAF